MRIGLDNCFAKGYGTQFEVRKANALHGDSIAHYISEFFKIRGGTRVKDVTMRDGRIEMLRFIFCLLIMMHHSYLIGCGSTRPFAAAYVFVEFFFYISGFFLCSRFTNSEGDGKNSADLCPLSPVQYTYSIWKGLLFYCVMNVLFMNTLLWATEHWSLLAGLNNLVKEIPEALMISMCGLEQRFTITPLWYVSAYLLVLPLFIYIISNHTKLLFGVGGLFVLLYYGYTYIYYGSTVQWHNYIGFCYDGLIRAFAGLTVGAYIYAASRKLRAMAFTKWGKMLLTMIEGGSFVAVLCISCCLNRDYTVVALLIIMLTIIFSNQSYTARIKHSTKWAAFLGQISVPLYFSHWFVGTVIARTLPDIAQPLRILLYYCLSLVLAMMLYWIKKYICRLPIRRILISDQNN